MNHALALSSVHEIQVLACAPSPQSSGSQECRVLRVAHTPRRFPFERLIFDLSARCQEGAVAPVVSIVSSSPPPRVRAARSRPRPHVAVRRGEHNYSTLLTHFE